MKNWFTIMACAASLASWAQQIPNAGFENWDNVSAGNQDKPTSWNTVNSSLGILGGTIGQTCFQSTDARTGSYSIQLKTIDPPIFPTGNPDINGIASTGEVETTAPYGINGGITFTGTPDSLVGYYKYAPVSNDIGTVEMVLSGANSDTIAHARFETPSTMINTYTRFSVPFVYRNTNTPTTAVHLLSSSDGFNPVVGSQIWIDDLSLVYNPVSLNELSASKAAFQVNVINDKLGVVNPDALPYNQLLVYNMMGELVLTSSKPLVSLQNLPVGVYIYTIPEVAVSGKFVR